MNKKPNNEIAIAEKLKLIKEREDSGTSERNLASKYKISKSQVHRILKNKDQIKLQSKNKNVKRARLNRMFSFCDLVFTEYYYIFLRFISFMYYYSPIEICCSG